jgi:hypothetical protein
MSPRIRCARCNKPVDHVYWCDDFDSKARLIEVTCHGETDMMTLDMKTLTPSTLGEMAHQEGVAFATELLRAKPD